MGPHVLHTLHMCHLRTWVEHKGHVLETRYYSSKTDAVRGFDPPPPRSCTSYWDKDKDASRTKESETEVLQYNEDIIYKVAANGYVRMQPN